MLSFLVTATVQRERCELFLSFPKMIKYVIWLRSKRRVWRFGNWDLMYILQIHTLGFPNCLGLHVTTNRWCVSFRTCCPFWSVFLHTCTLWEVHLTLHCLLNPHTFTSWNRRQWFWPSSNQAKKERRGDLEDFSASVLSSPFSSQMMENSYHSGALFSVRRATKLLGIMKHFHYWVIEAT